MKRNPIDIALISIILILILACIAAGLLGYYTIGFSDWDFRSSSVVEDNTLNFVRDDDQKDSPLELLKTESFATASSESPEYITKAFLRIYCNTSRMDMREDIEWDMSYSAEYTGTKVSMEIAEDNASVTLICTGVFWDTITVTASVDDQTASCKVYYEPEYLGLGAAISSTDPQDPESVSIAYEDDVPVIPADYHGGSHRNVILGYDDPADYGFKKGYYHVFRIGLVNHFGELEMIDQSSRSIFEQCQITVENDVPFLYAESSCGGAAEGCSYDFDRRGYIYDQDGQAVDWTEYERWSYIFEWSKYAQRSHEVKTLSVIHENNPDESSAIEIYCHKGDVWDFWGLQPRIKCRGEKQGHDWKSDDYYGFSDGHANGFDDFTGECLTEPYFWTGFSLVAHFWLKSYAINEYWPEVFDGLSVNSLNGGLPVAWQMYLSDLDPVVVVDIEYQGYSIEFVFDIGVAQ